MGRNKSDLNHEFPVFEKLSRVVAGEERIHQNVLVKGKLIFCFAKVYISAPIEGPPCGTVHTMYEALQRAESLSNDGNFLGELTAEGYQWQTYSEVSLPFKNKITFRLLKMLE